MDKNKTLTEAANDLIEHAMEQGTPGRMIPLVEALRVAKNERKAEIESARQEIASLRAQLEAVGTGGWMRNGALLYRLTDERRPANFDEIRVTMANGSRDIGQLSAQAERLLVMLTAPQPAAQAAPVDADVRLERERLCAAIKAEDDYCVEHGDYMLDSDDCIKIVRGEWQRPDFAIAARAAQKDTND